MDVVNRLGGDNKMSEEELYSTFNDSAVSLTNSFPKIFHSYLHSQTMQTSDYLVVYLRLLTSGYLQKEADFYQNFLEGDKTMQEFCQQV